MAAWLGGKVMKTLTKHLLWAVTTTLCLTVNPATAQELAETPAPQANEKSVENPGAEGAGETRKLIEEIIVSAERRDANLQDVPVELIEFLGLAVHLHPQQLH